jgi:hypothetical protein
MGQGDPGRQHQGGLRPVHCAPTFHNVSFRECIPMTAVGHERPKSDVRVESVRLPTADIGRRGP